MEKAMQDMLEAIRKVISTEGPAMKDCIRKALEEERDALQEIALARMKEQITAEDMQSQLDDEKKAFEAMLLACQVVAKAMIQDAANAAIEVFANAVEGAIKAALP